MFNAAAPVADYVIETETAALAGNPSLQEREVVARRLLPILVASENNLYNQDNLQKLALKLRIPERDLLAWAQEQRKLEAPKRPRSSAIKSWDNPPEPPPPDYETLASPEMEAEGSVALPPAPAQDAALEAYCLRVLLRDHHLLYQVNRKFRELAGDQTALLHGPLADLCADDFSRSDYRALVQMLYIALDQDRMEPLDYLRRHLDYELTGELEALLIDEQDAVRNRVSNRPRAEIADTWKQYEKRTLPVLDLSAELVQRALDLRRRRLQREREELRFLQMDSQVDGTGEQYYNHVELYNHAKLLIEKELYRRDTETRRW
jgi:hypothetical protein